MTINKLNLQVVSYIGSSLLWKMNKSLWLSFLSSLLFMLGGGYKMLFIV